ncbi:GNAT family N-acetyltransferase [Brachybacterium saurashtrense]|uniref:GNAT family N-acetyltransferase n=2 Tax=Brachybacterium saurashtrense TaxID=556288 RepID=A0A345YTR6_9MICO|nr:GNAT family N-acetyltransferase [Brachybacterium saurashtrense]RRR22744.1 GNAT family N-acetyltransferase [Brachybacterium saurashtrense]
MTGRSTLLVALARDRPVDARHGTPSTTRPSAVGVAQLVHADVPEVCNVGVLESRRGHGVGTALMAEAERRARPADRLRLNVGLDNPAARRLYERLGYRPTGELQTTTYDYVDACGVTRAATETSEWMEKHLLR